MPKSTNVPSDYEELKRRYAALEHEHATLSNYIEDLAAEVQALTEERDHLDAQRRAAEHAAQAGEQELQRFEKRFDLFWDRFNEMERTALTARRKSRKRVRRYKKIATMYRNSTSYRLGNAIVAVLTWPRNLQRHRRRDNAVE